MPETALKLRVAASRHDANFRTLLPLIEKDPGLCADLLHFANSAAYGVGHQVDTVDEAVLYFGMGNLVNFIMVSFSDRIIRESFSKFQHLDDFFAHSEQVSLAAFTLANLAQLPRHDQDVCKVTGLLHNVGKLVIFLATQQWGEELFGRPWANRQQAISEEERLYGLSHCDVGARLCRKWQFPERLLEGIGRHHNPVSGDNVSILGAFIYLGELLVIDDLPMDIIQKEFPATVLQKLNLSEERLAEARLRFLHIKSFNPRA